MAPEFNRRAALAALSGKQRHVCPAGAGRRPRRRLPAWKPGLGNASIQHAPAEGQVPAGTMAEKVTGRSSHPSMNWLTWMYTFLPAGGAPNRVAYRLVMSAEPCTAPGHMPRIRKSRQVSRPWLTGLQPRMMVLAPGSLGQPSLSAATPPVLVMEKLAGARSGNCGRSGGASTWASPNWDSVQLILMNNWKPLSEPLWLKRLL